jgi:intracellular sulfur oxidation DsrE/DsrF family protein
MNLIRIVAIGFASFALMTSLPCVAETKGTSKPAQSQMNKQKVHRVVVQVTQNDPGVMNMALNNAENLARHYADKGEKIDIEFVAYGPGLHMVRSDTSPVKDRLAATSGRMKNITFSGCGNTMGVQSRQENKDITLVPEARVVQTGIARILELQEQGWAYVRP